MVFCYPHDSAGVIASIHHLETQGVIFRVKVRGNASTGTAPKMNLSIMSEALPFNEIETFEVVRNSLNQIVPATDMKEVTSRDKDSFLALMKNEK